MSAEVDFGSLIGPVARKLLGEPNKRLSHESKGELRWGNLGSLVVNIRRGVWVDHEHSIGGGVLDLVCRVNGCSTRADAYHWLVEHGFAGCGPRDILAQPCSRGLIEKRERRDDAAGRGAANGDGAHAQSQLAKARAMWRHRQPIPGSLAERYLRQARCLHLVDWPATLGYLPAYRPDRHPALIAAFGLPREIEPGVLAITADAVMGVHLTFLKRDGSDKADTEPNKIMVGSSSGWPIVLAPPNDLLGLHCCEGIETGLSLVEATGCGVWAAGSSGRLPALADKVPAWIDFVRVVGEDDGGRTAAGELVHRLTERGIHNDLRVLGRGEFDR
jgi:hypothetical protein